ncbi:MAG: polysaccharide deacetylase family protein [Pirellulales bacterium]
MQQSLSFLAAFASRPARILLAAVLLIGMSCRIDAQQTWAERLGYPAGKRVLILHASDAGLCYESNAAVERSLAAGSASSGAVMATCPWFEDFVAEVHKHREFDVGLTITLTSELDRYRWTSVSSRSDVSGLIDTDGYLRRSVAELVYNTTPHEVAREIDAQLQKARAAGLRPTHLTCHQGVVFARADLAAAYLEAARRHWIPAVVIELTPQRLRQFQDEGLPVDAEMLNLIANYPLPKIDDIRLLPPGDTYEQRRERFLKQVAELSPGITQFVARPAVESEALKRLPSDWQQRIWDAQLLADPKVKAFFADNGVMLTDWREIMRRFEGENPTAKPRDEANEKPPADAPALEGSAVEPRPAR